MKLWQVDDVLILVHLEKANNQLNYTFSEKHKPLKVVHNFSGLANILLFFNLIKLPASDLAWFGYN